MNNFNNVRNETLRNEAKGTKPTCEASSVKDVLVMAVLHMCKKAIFFDVRLKVALYLAALFVVSLIGGNDDVRISGDVTNALSLPQTSSLFRSPTSHDPTIFSMFTL